MHPCCLCRMDATAQPLLWVLGETGLVVATLLNRGCYPRTFCGHCRFSDLPQPTFRMNQSLSTTQSFLS